MDVYTVMFFTVLVLTQTLTVIWFISVRERSNRRYHDAFYRVICGKLGIPVKHPSAQPAPPPEEQSASASPGVPPITPEKLVEMMQNPTEAELANMYEAIKQDPLTFQQYQTWNE